MENNITHNLINISRSKCLTFNSDAIITHHSIKVKDRAKVVDFILESNEHLGGNIRSSYFAVHLLDKCIENLSVNKNNFQLYSAACLSLALKSIFEEDVNQITICGLSFNMFTVDDLLAKEVEILELMDFDLNFQSAGDYFYTIINSTMINNRHKPNFEFMALSILLDPSLAHTNGILLVLSLCLLFDKLNDTKLFKNIQVGFFVSSTDVELISRLIKESIAGFNSGGIYNEFIESIYCRGLSFSDIFGEFLCASYVPKLSLPNKVKSLTV